MNDDLSNRYEAIVIGAGIGGLVCGCYLAKAGIKVLVIEKSAHVGGCCKSFTTKGFVFDAFAHSLGGLREEGVLDIVLRELEIKNRITMDRHDPSDIIITPDYKLCFWNELEKIIDDLKSIFHNESSNIDKVMNYLAYSKGGEAVRLRNITFLEFLNEFVKNYKLKALLSMPVLGNAGLPPSMISAFTATKLYQEFHLDGGYFPKGGMQALSDLIKERLKELGGSILLSRMVERIFLTTNSKIGGVELKGGRKIFSPIVVSNCDSRQTFNDLLGNTNIDRPNMSDMKTSSSVYSIFVGTKKSLIDQCKNFNATTWHMFNYDVEDMYLKAHEGNFNEITWFMIFSSPDKKGFGISILAPFKNGEFWIKNKNMLFEKILDSASERLPILRKIDIEHRAIITPQTIKKWTSNFQGAAYGWASTPAQCVVPGFTQNTSVDGLYLAGHWTTQTIGVSGVAYMGRDTAKIILSRHKK